jgi:hypothetical protein
LKVSAGPNLRTNISSSVAACEGSIEHHML